MTEEQFKAFIDMLKQSKPNDRSEKDRYYAILITELEKIFAFFVMFISGR
jgi:hypothetical protein